MIIVKNVVIMVMIVKITETFCSQYCPKPALLFG